MRNGFRQSEFYQYFWNITHWIPEERCLEASKSKTRRSRRKVGISHKLLDRPKTGPLLMAAMKLPILSCPCGADAVFLQHNCAFCLLNNRPCWTSLGVGEVPLEEGFRGLLRWFKFYNEHPTFRRKTIFPPKKPIWNFLLRYSIRKSRLVSTLSLRAVRTFFVYTRTYLLAIPDHEWEHRTPPDWLICQTESTTSLASCTRSAYARSMARIRMCLNILVDTYHILKFFWKMPNPNFVSIDK